MAPKGRFCSVLPLTRSSFFLFFKAEAIETPACDSELNEVQDTFPRSSSTLSFNLTGLISFLALYLS